MDESGMSGMKRLAVFVVLAVTLAIIHLCVLGVGQCGRIAKTVTRQ